MEIPAIAGSPRRKGNTDVLLDHAIAGAMSAEAGVEHTILSRLKIAPCIECNRCFETGWCVVQDDYQLLYDKTLESDGTILASPIFFMNVGAHAKAFMDRFRCLWALKYILKLPVPLPPRNERRRAIFLSTAGWHRTQFDCALSVVRAFLATIDAKLVGKLCINAIDDKGEVAEHPEILEEAYALGVQLASGKKPGDSP